MAFWIPAKSCWYDTDMTTMANILQ